MKPVLYGMAAMFYIVLFALIIMGNLSETSGESTVSEFGSVRLD